MKMCHYKGGSQEIWYPCSILEIETTKCNTLKRELEIKLLNKKDKERYCLKFNDSGVINCGNPIFEAKFTILLLHIKPPFSTYEYVIVPSDNHPTPILIDVGWLPEKVKKEIKKGKLTISELIKIVIGRKNVNFHI